MLTQEEALWMHLLWPHGARNRATLRGFDGQACTAAGHLNWPEPHDALRSWRA
jgi:hypothetical protein